jgi:acyl-CoA thioesterase I
MLETQTRLSTQRYAQGMYGLYQSAPRIIAVILIFVSVLALWLVFRSEEYPIVNYSSQVNGPIVAFGDSLVYGSGSDGGGGFVSMLSNDIAEPIINLGVPGDTTMDGLYRIDEVLSSEPRVVIVLLGGNDFLKKVPQNETFKNLRTIIERIQGQGAVVLLLGIRGGVLGDNFDKDFERLAEDTGSAFVPDVLDGLIGDAKYMTDQIHPNDVGYRLIAERVLPVLQSVLW